LGHAAANRRGGREGDCGGDEMTASLYFALLHSI
jgi:hypothetical protein